MRFSSVLCLLFSIGTTFAQPIVYVTETGAGDGSGSSWANALPGTLLATHLPTATPGTQFWVASGAYYPTTLPDITASSVLLQA
jgi:hypothetical protein